MKARDYLFLCEHIKDGNVMYLIRSFIKDGKSRKKLPRKFHKELPDLPYNITKPKDCDMCVRVLIKYIGSNIVYVLPDNTSNFVCPYDTQQGICVKLSNEGVSWKLYQTNADEVKHNDVKKGVRTYSNVKEK